MKKVKLPVLGAVVIAVILMVGGSFLNMQNAKACTTQEVYTYGTKFLWDCVGSSGHDCGRCKPIKQKK